MKNISKSYDNGSKNVVKDFNLVIEEKEFVVFVGPSGCGKSTTLRLIAGLEEITGGELFINQQAMNDVLPKDREISMVFQSYALFPHMNVENNLSFGLKVKKISKEKIKQFVDKTAQMVGLEKMLQQMPKELSGGQKQRVALGRAMIKQTDIFLMDEPLSNLDAKLRTQMREEIIRLHRQLGTTTIYVTHDQVEAMTMATKIVVLNQGEIQQVGTPYEIFTYPKNKFVAGFMGTPSMNFLEVENSNNQLRFHELTLLTGLGELSELPAQLTLGVRPESISITESNGITAKVSYIELLGSEMLVHVLVNQQKLVMKTIADLSIKEDETIQIQMDSNQLYLFDAQNGEILYSRGQLIDATIE